MRTCSLSNYRFHNGFCIETIKEDLKTGENRRDNIDIIKNSIHLKSKLRRECEYKGIYKFSKYSRACNDRYYDDYYNPRSFTRFKNRELEMWDKFEVDLSYNSKMRKIPIVGRHKMDMIKYNIEEGHDSYFVDKDPDMIDLYMIIDEDGELGFLYHYRG